MLDSHGHTPGVPPREAPLSFAQRRLWLAAQVDRGSRAYNERGAWRLEGPLDEEGLARALAEVFAAHDILRTTFHERDGAPAARVHAAGGVTLARLDARSVPAARQFQVCDTLLEAFFDRPFDLADGPLARALVIRLGPTLHVLAIGAHHIVCDGDSFGVIWQQLTAAYRARVTGQPAPPAPPSPQYADYARWEQEWLTPEVMEQGLEYWRPQLTGLPPLQVERTASAGTISPAGAWTNLMVDAETAARLREIARQAQTTLPMVLLATFLVVLSRWTGQRDFGVGTPVSTRARQELAGVVGFFVNMLVLRLVCEPGQRWIDVMRRLGAVARGAYAHQFMPFDRLVEALAPERTTGRHPLFQLAWAFRAGDGRTPSLAGLRCDPWGLRRRRDTAFDLDIVTWSSNADIRGSVIYRRDAFEPGTVQRIVEAWGDALSVLASAPLAKIEDVSWWGPRTAGVMQALGAGEARTEPWRDVWTRMRELADAAPDAMAVCADDLQVTRGWLVARARGLAERLEAAGVRGEARVGVHVTRGIPWVACMLAIWARRAVYVPMDPDYPAARLAQMAASARPVVVLTDRGGTWTGADSLAIVEQPDHVPSSSTENEAPIDAERLAYVIYTSGSTGEPKGAMVTHGGMVNHLLAKVESLDMSPRDRLAQTAPASFDVSVWQVMAPLLSGGVVDIFDSATVADDVASLAAWTSRGITIVETVPSQLIGLGERQQVADTPVRSLRWMIANAEPLGPVACAAWQAGAAEACGLLNAYGPTECSDDVTHYEVRPDAAIGRWMPLGRPLRNTQLRVVDARGTLVPVGATGEIWVGGTGVGRGYWAQPVLTAARFVPDPFSGEPGARAYRTGDRGRWRVDGTLEFLGRIDTQVKVRGFRIEPGEIEARLGTHPGVRQCAVGARERSDGDWQLVAYVVAAAAGAPDVAALRAYLGERLPDYMIPTAWEWLPVLPLSPNGKVDRRALPEPTWGAVVDLPQGDELRAGQGTPIEEIIAEVWADVLRLPRVGRDQSFFDLGGHSLLATQMMARVRQACGVDIPLRALFDAPTVRGLAATVADARRRGAPAPPSLTPPPERPAVLPLSFTQQRLWFLAQLEPESAAYHVAAAVRLRGTLDEPALARSLTAIAARHETLRTRFTVDQDVPAQVVLPPADVPLPMVDLSTAPDREAQAQAIAHAEARRRFHLAAGEVWRVRLLRLAADEHVLLLTMHHIVSDGWSMGVLVEELTSRYRASARGEELTLPDLPLQYADYALWQRQWLQGEALDEQSAYWRGQLDGLRALSLPTDRPRPAASRRPAASVELELPIAETLQLVAVARREGATLFMILLASLQALLARWTGQEDVALGVPVANRHHGGTERLIGCFMNLLVLRTDLRTPRRLRDLLHQVRATALDAYAHQDLPFERLVEARAQERGADRMPLVPVGFALQNAPLDAVQLEGLSVEPFPVTAPAAKFDLMLNITEGPRGLSGWLEYDADLFDARTIRWLVSAYRDLLMEIATRSDVADAGVAELLAAADERGAARASARGRTTLRRSLARPPAAAAATTGV